MFEAILAIVLAGGAVVLCEESNYVCEGNYKIDSIQKCDNPEQYKFDLSVTKRKINRTHDGFTLNVELPEEFSYEFGMRINVYSKCDGGYKLTDTFENPSLCGVINQFVKVEFERILADNGYMPPNCPIAQGLLELKDYVMDKDNIPTQSKCGQFKNDIFILEGETEVGCLIVYNTITPVDDEENEDD